MRICLVLAAILALANADVSGSVSGSIGTNTNGAIVNGSSEGKPSEKPGQSASGSVTIDGQTPDAGGFLKGIANSISSFFHSLIRPTQIFGNALCFSIDQAFAQIARLEDYAGKTFSVSVDGQPILNGTISANGQIQPTSYKRYHAHKKDFKSYLYNVKDDKGDKGDKKHGIKHQNGENHN